MPRATAIVATVAVVATVAASGAITIAVVEGAIIRRRGVAAAAVPRRVRAHAAAAARRAMRLVGARAAQRRVMVTPTDDYLARFACLLLRCARCEAPIRRCGSAGARCGRSWRSEAVDWVEVRLYGGRGWPST